MKRLAKPTLGSIEWGIQLSPGERGILRQASIIAGQIRDTARLMVGEDEWERNEMDITLAHVEHDARELAETEGGFILIEAERAF